MDPRDNPQIEDKKFSSCVLDAKNSSAFFAPDKKPPTAAINKQLFPFSCTAFSCALLFTQALRKDETDVLDANKMLRLFEIAIYFEIWTKPNGIADENKSMCYLAQFCTNMPLVLTEEGDIDSLEPREDDVLFMVSKGKDNILHTELVTVAENKFLYNEKEYDSLGDINIDIQKIIVIDVTELDINLIEKFYVTYKAMLKTILESYNPDVLLHIYFLFSLIQCIDVFPEFKPFILTQLTEAPEKYLTSMEEICTAIRSMPETKTAVSRMFLQCPEKYLQNMADIQNACEILSGNNTEIMKAARKVFFDSPSKFLRSKLEIISALKFFNSDADKENIKSAVLHELGDETCTSKRFYYLAEYFKQYENELVMLLFKHGQKHLRGIDNVKMALSCFPNHKNSIHDFINQSPSNYLSENEYEKVKKLLCIDQDRRQSYK